MRQLNCHESFSRGKADRKLRPLPFGQYKLAECLRGLDACRDEIERVRDVTAGKATKWHLLRCTNDDKHLWLKELPAHVAYRLGYDVLPGLLALVTDGASHGRVSETYIAIEDECLALLGRLESARVDIKRDIGVEYAQMKAGRSLLEPLVVEAMRLTSRALATLMPQESLA